MDANPYEPVRSRFDGDMATLLVANWLFRGDEENHLCQFVDTICAEIHLKSHKKFLVLFSKRT